MNAGGAGLCQRLAGTAQSASGGSEVVDEEDFFLRDSLTEGPGSSDRDTTGPVERLLGGGIRGSQSPMKDGLTQQFSQLVGEFARGVTAQLPGPRSGLTDRNQDSYGIPFWEDGRPEAVA